MPFYEVTEIKLRLVDCKDSYESIAQCLNQLSEDIVLDEEFTSGERKDLFLRTDRDTVEKYFGKVQYIQTFGQLLQLDKSLVPKSLEGSVADILIDSFQTRRIC